MTITRQQGVRGVLLEAKGTFYNATVSTIAKGTICKFTTTAVEAIAPSTDGTTNFGDTGLVVADVDIPTLKYGVCTMFGGCEVLAGTALATPGTWTKSDSTGRAIAVSQAKDKVVGYTVGIATAANDMIPFFLCPQASFYTA